jgi:hypothetical protein
MDERGITREERRVNAWNNGNSGFFEVKEREEGKGSVTIRFLNKRDGKG